MSNYHEIMLGFAWLKSTLSADSALTGYAPGGVYRAIAPNATTPPFIIMARQAGVDVTTANGYRIMDDLVYQVVAVGQSSATDALASAASRIDALLGGPPGTPVSGPVVVNSITVGRVLACYRQSPLQLDDPPVNGIVWTRVGGLYRMIVQQVAT